MTAALDTIGWAIIAAVTVWGFTLLRASRAMTRMESAHRREVAYWKNETARARAHAAQVTQDRASWAAGCQQGRDDVISIVPLIIAARELHPEPGASAAAGAGAGDLAGHG